MFKSNRILMVLKIFTAATVAAACGDDPIGPSDTAPTTGSLEVTTTTTGDDIDPDGYAVLVSRPFRGPVEPERPIGVNAMVTFSGLEPDAYVVILKEVATNCRVHQVPPAEGATVRAGEIRRWAFDVTCDALTGNLAGG